jgi:drug/metabolite transporter (DMT)-like permease
MLTLIFGSIAALCWGVHDACVRLVAARSGPVTAFLCVLAIGGIALLPLTFLGQGWGAINTRAFTLATLSGFCYALAGYALYRAFEIGPVRLVAPLIGAFPVLSLLWATLLGNPPTLPQTLAVAAIVIGVGLNAILSDGHAAAEAARGRGPGAAILWSLVACGGFALTFAFGQGASAEGGGMALLLVPRLAAFALLGTATALMDRRTLTLRQAPLGILAVMGLCDATALGLVQWSGGLPHPEFAAVASSTFGMVTVILAAMFLKERMSLPQWGTVAMVFAAIGYLAL